MYDEISFQGKTNMEKEVLVRYPKAHDVDELVRYANALSNERTYIGFQGELITKNDAEKQLEEALKAIKDKKLVQLLAFNKNTLIGSAEIFMKSKTSSHIGLLGISIAKEFRGDGIGKLLMKLLLQEAEEKLPQLKTIILGVFSTNSIAQKMYKDFGFIEYGRLPHGIIRNEKFEDDILMYKKVRQ